MAKKPPQTIDEKAVSQQTETMRQLGSVIEDYIKNIEKMTEASTDQARVLRDVADAGKTVNEMDFTDAQKATSDLSEAQKEALKSLQKTERFMTSKMVKASFILGAAWTGLVQGMRNTVAMGKSILGLFTSLASTVLNLAAGIASIPLKIFKAFVDAAASLDGGTELMTAIEKVRETFGDLHKYGAKAVMDTTKSLKGFSDTGLSTWRVFGTLAERMDYVREVATEMGATWTVLNKEFVANGGALLAYQKGLGVSKEDMKSLSDRAITMGDTLTTTMNDISKQTLGLGDAFGMDQKLIGRALSKATADVKHFGQMTVKEIGQAVVYSKKLGVELDKIVGTLDAFETFDTAAESSAKLAQSFGIQVDALKMMEAQSPAEQIDELRKSMKAAGVASEGMNRQQLKLLATQTGLDEETAKQVFSSKNQGVSLDDVKKKSEAAAKAQMTQTQAMSKLADSIERMVKQGPQLEGSFFKMFIKGFKDGIFMSKEFMSVMLNIRRGLYTVYAEGRRLGKAFVEMFPGMKTFLDGVREFFQPDKFKKLAGGVTDIFIQFMKDLSAPGGKASFKDLMDKLKEHFFSFFNKQDSAGGKMLTGMKAIMQAMSTIIAGAFKWIGEKVADGIRSIVDFITDPSAAIAKAKAGAAGGVGIAISLFAPIIDAIKYAAKAIWPPMKEMFAKLWDRAVEFLTSDTVTQAFSKVWPKIALVMLGPAVMRAFAGAVITFLGAGIKEAMFGSGAKGLFAKIGEAANAFMGKMPSVKEIADQKEKIKGTGGLAQEAAKVVNGEGSDGKQSGGFMKALKGAGSFLVNLVKLAAVIFVGGVALAAAVGAMKLVLDAAGIKTLDDAKVPMLLLAEMCVGGALLAGAAVLVNRAGNTDKVAAGMATIAIAVIAATGVGALLIALLSAVGSIETLQKGSEMMWNMSKVFLMMVPVIVAAGLIGAAIVGSSGLAALAIGAGLATLSIAVVSLSTVTMEIMTELNKMEFNPGFDQKVDAFVKVLDAVRSLIDSVAGILKSMEPSLVEVISPWGETMAEKVDSAKSLIDNLIGDKGRGIEGLIQSMLGAVRDLANQDGKLIQGANMFAALMKAMTAMLTAIKPSDAMFEAGNSLWAAVGLTDDFEDMVSASIKFSGVMKDNVMKMLTGPNGVLAMITVISDLPLPAKEQLDGITSVFGVVGNIMQMLTPSEGLIKAFSNTSEVSSFWGMVNAKSSEFKPEAMKAGLAAMTENMSIILPVLTGQLLDVVASQVESFDATKLDVLKAFGPIIGGLGQLVSSVVGSFSKPGAAPPTDGDVKKAVEGSKAVADSTLMIGTVFAALGKVLPQFMTSVKGIIDDSDLSDPTFITQLGTVKTIFDILAVIPQLATSMADLMKKGEGTAAGPIDTSPIDNTIDAMEQIVGKLTSGALSDIVGGINLGVADIDKAAKNIAPLKEQISIIATGVGEIGNSLTQYSNAVVMLTSDTVMKGVGVDLGIVGEMVNKVQALEDAMAGLGKIDIPAKLKRLGTSMGLGTNQIYKVDTKDIKITINLKVSMDVDEVERVMIMREKSIINNRINVMADNSTEKFNPSPAIPKEYSSSYNGVANPLTTGAAK